MNKHTPSIPANRPFIPVLTGLRIIAACMVFFSHFPVPSKRVGIFISEFCTELYIGVSVFFVLSGFLITFRYADQFKNNSAYSFSYFKKRFARIYPMYFILTTLSFIMYKIFPLPAMDHNFQAGSDNYLALYFLNISFLKGFFNDFAFSGIAQGWTLTVEECFYICAPLILLVSNKVNLMIQVVFLYAIGFFLVQLPDNFKHSGFFENNQFMLIMTFFGRCFEFYVGIQLAFWYKKNNSLLPGARFTFLGITAILAIVSLLVFTKDKQAIHYYGLYTTKGLIINNLLLPLAIALLFKGLLREKTFIRNILESSVFRLLGKSSYIFYLIHMGFISELLYKYVTHNYLLNLPILLLLAIIMFKTIEQPLNNYINKV